MLDTAFVVTRELSADTEHDATALDDPDLRPHTSLEHRRAVASVRGKLFGESTTVRVGRYELERRLGAGGMGEVFLARDPELDRMVALKRVRTEVGSHELQLRLRAEAQVLARLSHPNVVQVHEVGEHDGQTFLAMEYVEGTTLTSWLEQPRTWREILDVFVAAGRGLAAAHSAGVVHRDFKPDNVLIGADERVRVADFGLALALGSDAQLQMSDSAGQVAGTVCYMSREQLLGHSIDARSDQFSFCVALYEALWGTAPFDRSSIKARLRVLEADEVLVPPRGRRVPRRLWSLLRRGMRTDPARRWGSLDELLDLLAAIPGRRRRIVGAAIVVPSLVLAGWLLTVLSGTAPAPCENIHAEIDAVWNPDFAAQVEAGFAAVGVSHAADSFVRVRDELERWTAVWEQARTGQCRAANEGRDTEALAGARRACLEHQRRELRALVELLRSPDVAVVDHAVDAVLALPRPLLCEADLVLRGPAPPPAELEAEVARLREELAQITAQRHLGQVRVEDAERLLERVRALGYHPLLAEVTAELARTELAGGSPKRGLALLDEAAALAVAAEHRQVMAEVWTESAMHGLTDYPRDGAEHELELADAAWQALGPTDESTARLAFARAHAAHGPDARALFGRVVELQPHGPLTPAALDALATRDTAHALELREQALAAAEQVFGRMHPNTAVYAYNLGVELQAHGDLQSAQSLLERAVSIWDEGRGRPHPQLSLAHLVLADQAMQTGRLDTAEQHARTIASIDASTLPSGHADLARGPQLLAQIAGLRGDRTSARRYAREALSHYQRSGVPASDDRVVALRLDLAGHELGLNELELARQQYAELLELGLAAGDEALARLGLAELELRGRQFASARDQLLRIDALDPTSLGEQRASYELVRALVELRGGCRACAPTLALRVSESISAGGWTLELLAPWLHELELTQAEAEQLGLGSLPP